MSATLNYSETQIFAALRAALSGFGMVQSDGQSAIPIVKGQVNRAPEPNGQDFLVFWPLSRERLAMNIDSWIDASFTGSIATNVLTVTQISSGNLAPNQTLYGVGVTAGCQILTQLSGPVGGIGTYSVSSTSDRSSQLFYNGTKTLLQKIAMTVQCDIHGPTSGDNAQRLSTIWRDQSGIDAFVGTPLVPLYCSDPSQVPFDNGEQQYEERYIVDLTFEADLDITLTQQFADQLYANLTSVDAAFPVQANIAIYNESLYGDGSVYGPSAPTWAIYDVSTYDSGALYSGGPTP